MRRPIAGASPGDRAPERTTRVLHAPDKLDCYQHVLITTILTFNYFDMIWVLTRGGPQNATQIFPTRIYELGFG